MQGDSRWFLLEFKIKDTVAVSHEKSSSMYLKDVVLIQAQTEAEAVAKYKLNLKAGRQTYHSHKNKTIL